VPAPLLRRTRRLALVKALRAEIDEFERQHVARALTLGEPVTAIARALEVSRQSAHRRFRDLVPPRQPPARPHATPEAKLAVEYARREARALGASSVTSAHLLLGILRSGDCETVMALNAGGITLEAARAAAAARDGRPEGEDDARTVLAEALRAAQREGADRFGIEHLLLGALTDPDGGAAQVLCALGVSPESADRRAFARGPRWRV
jgi:ATP-dependent Clp protease ATP-binding subunit ClpA